MPRQTRILTGIPLWLVQEYLEALGGEPDEAGGLSGPGWTARLEQLDDYALGAVRVGRVSMELDGDLAALGALGPALDRKLLRAGG
jgi:hypothetical protein